MSTLSDYAFLAIAVLLLTLVLGVGMWGARDTGSPSDIVPASGTLKRDG